MKRADAIKHITAAIAAGDTKTATRIFIESRISKKTYDEAYAAGVNLKKLVEERCKSGERKDS